MNSQGKTPFLNLEYIFLKIYEFFSGLKDISVPDLSFFKIFSFFIAIFLGAAIFVFLMKIISLERKTIFYSAFTDFSVEPGTPETRRSRWDFIKKLLDSEDENDWKKAVIEADMLLDELLAVIGYEGENLGDKLKIIKPADFKNLKDAWEANRLRAKITREPHLKITREEAKTALEKYQKALRELRYL